MRVAIGFESHAKRRDSWSWWTSAAVPASGDTKGPACSSTGFWSEEALDRSSRGDADLFRTAESRLETRDAGLCLLVRLEMSGEEVGSANCSWEVL